MTTRCIATRVGALALVLAVGSGTDSMAQKDNQTALLVSLSDARLSHKTLSFTWHLKNRSSEPLYVYSTFLSGPPAATAAQPQPGVICERTSLRTAETAGVNAYPPAKFLRIEAGETVDGRFVDRQADPAVFRGITTVEMEVAFGREVEELKRQIALTSGNGNHPANPIVSWQTEALGKSLLTR